MTRFEVAMNYGVRTIDDRCMVRIENVTAPDYFRGIPVLESDLCVESITRVKKWKRLNRLPKIRRRTCDRYFACIVRPPITAVPTIICHPKVLRELKYRLVNNSPLQSLLGEPK